jgi:hypothetical protein
MQDQRYTAVIAAPGVARQTVTVLDDRAPSPWSDDPGRWMLVRLPDDRELVLPFTYMERRLPSPTEDAYTRGVEAANAAASWIIDGNTKPEAIAYVVALLDTGDPRVDDYLPRRPDLSGEYADDPTPQSLAADILGADWETHGYNAPDFLPAEQVDAIADAYEEGVDETFVPECERLLRAALEV